MDSEREPRPPEPAVDLPVIVGYNGKKHAQDALMWAAADPSAGDQHPAVTGAVDQGFRRVAVQHAGADWHVPVARVLHGGRHSVVELSTDGALQLRHGLHRGKPLSLLRVSRRGPHSHGLQCEMVPVGFP